MPNKFKTWSDYLYPSGVLKNKFGINNAKELNLIETNITTRKTDLLTKQPIPPTFDLNHLKSIHKTLFSDIYEWAGQERSVDMVKGDSAFCRVQFIRDAANEIFPNLRQSIAQLIKNTDKKTFCTTMAHYFGEVNALHPFREGNGRTQKIFFAQVAYEVGYELKWNKTTKEQVNAACIDAMRGKYDGLAKLFNDISEPVDYENKMRINNDSKNPKNILLNLLSEERNFLIIQRDALGSAKTLNSVSIGYDIKNIDNALKSLENGNGYEVYRALNNAKISLTSMLKETPEKGKIIKRIDNIDEAKIICSKLCDLNKSKQNEIEK